jgi:hypothetical protein
MPLVKQSAPSVDGEGRCFRCQGAVTWARIRDGRRFKPIAIEPCAAGTGRMAILATLFETIGTPIVDEVVNGTSWRRHDEHCPGPKSFTGQARDRKARP